jgi:uncharacterized lipoprotein NlpE involved in copper resistance
MKKKIAKFTLLLAVFCLFGCGNDPGPLAGTWRMNAVVPMTVQFRSGETEAMGMIEKVSYETKGSDVLVTYKDGMAKGMAVRYTMIDRDTARSELGVLKRIK